MNERTEEAIEIIKLVNRGLREDIEIEERLAEFEEQELEQLSTKVENKVQETVEIDEREEVNIEKIKEDLDNLKEEIEKFGNNFKKIYQKEDTLTQKINKMENSLEGEKESVKNILEDVQGHLENVQDLIQREMAEELEEFEEVLHDISDVEIALSIWVEEREDLKKARTMEQEIKAYTEREATGEGKERLLELLEETEGFQNRAEQLIQRVENDEEHMIETLRQAAQLFENLETIDKTEVKELKAEIEEAAQIGSEIDKIDGVSTKMLNGTDDDRVRSVAQDYKGFLTAVKQTLNNEAEELETLLEEESFEFQVEHEYDMGLRNRIESTLAKLSQLDAEV